MGACSQLCKFVIFIFNLLYTVVGLAFLVVGVWLRVGNNTRDISEASFVTGQYVLITVGIVMLITVCFGDVGGCYEKTTSLAMFCVLLVILIIAQIALYIQKDNVGPHLVEFYVVLYAAYLVSSDLVMGGTLRVMHYTLNCCGAVGVVGLDPTSHTCPEKSGLLDRFMSPCPTVLLDVFSANPPVAMGIFYGNAVLMILCLLCSLALVRMLQQTVPPRYVLLTQSVLSLSGPPAQPQPRLYPADGCLDSVVLTTMAPDLLAEA